MPKITVELTDEQAEFLKDASRLFTPGRPGDTLLAAAFAGFSMLNDLEESGSAMMNSVNDFVVERGLPDFDIDRAFDVGVVSRPRGSYRAQKEKAVAAT